MTVSRPCGGSQACGTLADVAKTLNTIRGTAGQVELAAKHENAQLATLDRQEAQIYADVHAELLSAQTLTASLTETSREAAASLHSADQALQAANVTIEAAQPALRGATVTLSDVDALVADPDLKRMLAASADSAAEIDGTATDVRKVADSVSNKFLHPPPKHWWNYAGRLWYVVWQGAMLAK